MDPISLGTILCLSGGLRTLEKHWYVDLFSEEDGAGHEEIRVKIGLGYFYAIPMLFFGNKYLLHACITLESTLCRLHHGMNIILFPLCNFLHVLVNHIDEMLSVGVLLALHGHMNETNLCHDPCVMCLALIRG